MHSRRVILCLLVVLSLLPGALVAQEKRLLNQEDVGYVNALRSAPRTLTSTTIAAAIATIAGASRTLFLSPGTWVISGNLTVPVTITLWIPAGTTVQVNTGVVLTLLAPFIGEGQFTGAGTIRAPAQTLSPLNFGALCNNSHDDTTAFQKAAAAMGSGGTLRVPAGYCLLSTPVTFTASGKLVGEGADRSVLVTTTATQDAVQVIGADLRFEVKELTFATSVTRTAGRYLYVGTPNPTDAYLKYVRVHQVVFRGGWIDLELANASYATITENMFEEARHYGVWLHLTSIPDAGDFLIQGNVFSTSENLGTSIAVYLVGSGWRVSGNKILGNFNVGIQMEPAATSPTACCSDVIVSGNSIEHFKTYGIFVQTPGSGLQFFNVQIFGNQLVTALTGVYAPIVASGDVRNLVITGNIIACLATGSGCIGLAANGFSVSPTDYHISGNVLTGLDSTTIGVQVPDTTPARGTIGVNRTAAMPVPYSGHGAVIQGFTVPFAALTFMGADGSMGHCTDCTVTSGANNTCASGGTGALTLRIAGAYRCFASQN